VQQTQQNCFLAFAFLVVGTLVAPALATAAGPPRPDPLLTESKGPCDPKLDGPDYVAGTDVDGNPVVPADATSAKVPLPEGILLPVGAQPATTGAAAKSQALASFNRKDLDTILNPAPACPQPKAH
jgi:hypothetical protein